MKKTHIITPKKEPIDIDSKLKDTFGKTVLAENAEKIGVVKDIVYQGNKIEGFLVKQNSLSVFIDYSHIKDISGKSVFLKINPVTRLVGMTVFDQEGKRLGKVIQVQQKGTENELKSIVLKKNVFSKKEEISASKVDISTKNIILKNYEKSKQ